MPEAPTTPVSPASPLMAIELSAAAPSTQAVRVWPSGRSTRLPSASRASRLRPKWNQGP